MAEYAARKSKVICFSREVTYTEHWEFRLTNAAQKLKVTEDDLRDAVCKIDGASVLIFDEDDGDVVRNKYIGLSDEEKTYLVATSEREQSEPEFSGFTFDGVRIE